MTPQQILPWVSSLLQSRYTEARRKYIESEPSIPNWPKRRTRKHKPIPGVYDLAADQEG